MEKIVINNIASLRLRKGTPNSQVEILGYDINKDGGEGSFYWDDVSTETDNGGTIFQVTGVSTGRWKRIYPSNYINMAWFGIDKTGVTQCTTQFEIAKTLIPLSGGTIYFPTGTYICDNNSWKIYRSNLTIKGDGIDKTILDTPSAASEGLALAPYRDSGWDFDPTHIFTYEDSAPIGRKYLDIKTGTGQADLSLLTPGKVVFLNAGASFYDQQYGEFNIVDSVVGQRVYFKYGFGRDYNSSRSSYYGEVASNYTVPAIGSTANITLSTASVYPTASGTKFISLGNELFEITASSGPTLTLRNLGKGNTSTTIPAGTKVYKYRALVLTPSTAVNNTFEDFTLIGHRKACVFSNSVKTYLNRVKFIRKPGDITGGGWIDGDDGRDLQMINCKVDSEGIISGQMARSFGDAKFINTEFNQVGTEISEFNFNFLFKECDFNSQGMGASDVSKDVLNIGSTTSNVKVVKCNFNISSMNSAITSTDIQTYSNASVTNVLVEGNNFNLDNMRYGINIFRSGTVKIIDNTISGVVLIPFGTSGSLSYGTTNQLDSNQRAIFGSECIIRNNRFDGYCDYLINRGPSNLTFEDNNINRFGPYDKIAPVADSSANGNIIRSESVSVPFERIVVKNNTFRNWYYLANSLAIVGTRDIRWNISNNLFINPNSPFRSGSDFVLNDFTPDISLYGSINYIPKLKSKDADWAAYIDLITQSGGTISDSHISAGKQFLSDIYNNNLRDKIQLIHLFLGDQKAAKVPILGWEKTTYKSLNSGTLTFGINGFTGDGVDDYGIVGISTEFDISNIGLFIQITNPNSNVSNTYFGRYLGANNSSLRIYQGAVSTLSGIGGASIVSSSYTPSNGFVYSGKTDFTQLNYIDTTNHQLNNTTLGDTQITTSSNISLLAAINATNNVTNFSNATLGAVGITSLLTLDEVQALRVIIYNLMTTLGRPTQTTTLTNINTNQSIEITKHFRPDITVDLSNIDLNNMYPTAIPGTQVIAKNITGGGIIYEKDSTSTWIKTAILNP